MPVPNKSHISWVNDIAQYVLASDVSPESAFPITNAQNDEANVPVVFDMSSDTTLTITGSVSSQRAGTCFALHNHNMPEDATVSLKLYENASQSGTLLVDVSNASVAYDIPWSSVPAGISDKQGHFVSGTNKKAHFSTWFETVVYRSFQIDISLPTAINDQLIIDKIWLGYAHAFEYGHDYGFDASLEDRSQHSRKPGGGMQTTAYEAVRKLNLSFPGMSNAERQIFRSILAAAEKGGDLLVNVDPNNALGQKEDAGSIYKRLSDSSFISEYFNWNNTGLALEEN